MFQAPLCPSSGAQEYYTGGCRLWCLVLWFSSRRSGVELRVMCPVCRMLKQRFLLQILLLAQHVSGHHYAHHQELKSIIQWLLPVVFGAVKMDDVKYKLNGIRVFWVLNVVCYICLL